MWCYYILSPVIALYTIFKYYIKDYYQLTNSLNSYHFPDNHDIISMKLYQLMVEHTPEEENLDWTKIEPSVSLLKSPKGRRNYRKLDLELHFFHIWM